MTNDYIQCTEASVNKILGRQVTTLRAEFTRLKDCRNEIIRRGKFRQLKKSELDKMEDLFQLMKKLLQIIQIIDPAPTNCLIEDWT